MTHATENLFKTIISAHVFILYYKVSNNYTRALKDEKTFTSRRRIDYSRRAFPVHRFATFPYISASKLVLFFPRASRTVLASPWTSFTRKIRFIWKFFLARRHSSWKLFFRMTTDRVLLPLQHSFSNSRRNPLSSLFLFLAADIQRYIKYAIHFFDKIPIF